jgi:hypothetical protein
MSTMLNICPACGFIIPWGVELCPHHAAAGRSDWALGNKAWCDFFHRGVVPPVAEGQAAWEPVVYSWDWAQLIRPTWRGVR